jgi:hypothetical protein
MPAAVAALARCGSEEPWAECMVRLRLSIEKLQAKVRDLARCLAAC